MFRLVLAVLATIGLFSLLFGSAGGAAAGAGWLLIAPLLFLAKIMLFVMLFGLFRYGFGHGRRYYRRPGGDWRRQSPDTDVGPSTQEEFEDWHRLQHAREEVDGWVDGVL